MKEEKTFEEKVKSYLKARGCYYVKYFANRNTKAGIADVLACINGYFVAIEVKASNGRVSELQRYNQKQVRLAGGISIILYPSGYDDFKKLVECLLQDDLENALNYAN